MNYKILIIEDEKAARERLISMKLWENNNYSIAGTASNGKEGLKMYRETSPDVIITDIEMPIMNGLDLIEEVRKVNSNLPIIILSCYESFSYAQRAITLKVNDYLIKDFLEEKVLKTTLCRVLKNYTPRQTKNKENINHWETNSFLPALPKLTDETFLKMTKTFTRDSVYAILFIHIDDYKTINTQITIFAQTVAEELHSDCQGYIFLEEEGSISILLGSTDNLFPSETASRLIDYVDHKLSLSITIAAGSVFRDIKKYKTELDNVRELLKYSVFLGRNRVIIRENISQISWLDPHVIYSRLDLIKHALLTEQRDLFFSRLKQLYTIQTSGMIEYNYIEYINTYLISLLLIYSDEKHVREIENFDHSLLEFKELHILETINDMYSWLKKRYRDFFTFIDRNNNISGNIHVRAMIKMIREEYTEDLSLNRIADKLNIHKVYLSRVFKKETGKTCYEYIQNYRISKAKNLLLSTSCKISEIAEKSGFRNYDQFASTFKRLTGETPGKFQKKLK